LRIAVFTGSYPAISETFVIQEINQLKSRGHSVDVFSLKRGTILSKNTDIESIEVTYLTGIYYNGYKKFIYAFWLLIKKPRCLNFFFNYHGKKNLINLIYYCHLNNNNNFDIIHCHFSKLGNLVVDIRKRLLISGRIITSFHGSGLVTLNSKKGIYRDLIDEGDYFIANSEFTKRIAIKKGYPNSKMGVIPAQFNSDLFKRDHIRSYPKSKIIILSIGRLVPFKGFIYGIQAIHNLILNGMINIEYRIVGAGSEYSRLSREIQQRGLGENILLLGALSSKSIWNEYLNADVFLMPGIYDGNGRAEAQGVVLQEAQAMEVPVIASKVGGMEDGLLDGVTGFFTKEKDVDDIADKIRWFIDNQQEIPKMGTKGKEFVHERFNQKKITDQLISLYVSLLQE
jgi:colanic acid/amylovoran biosynthesis glycosyltransferase